MSGSGSRMVKHEKLAPSMPPPTGRRAYAHIDRLSLICPGCGEICLPGGPRDGGRGYDRNTSLFRCPKKICGYTAYLGVIFWPRAKFGAAALPEDHTLTPGEAVALRQQLSYAETRSSAQPRDPFSGERRRGPTNRVCTCTETCPVHPPVPGIE